MKSGKNVPRNPRSVKTRFAVKFVEAMKKLDKKRPTTAYKRYLAVRAAACVSLASAVGPRRAWSRAVLKNLIMPRGRKSYPAVVISPRKRVGNNNPKRRELEEEDDLRRLVPGGEGMGFCRLLTESAHYIQCLRDQVQVMTSMLDHCYST
ncbi:transcription factor ibh1 [Phtheirospermum japonicum]|uniref:Transcription factor ibh1 n=1 Tax=Phtheirospermum japonicum TaxID=374723 RepID=A0A830BWP1_9LAMI|nr:transcription factor ibh1 [Phtheirospermum japonicum]